MQRHQMDHFRDAKLYRDEELVLEGFEGFISCREKSARRKEWHGYFLAPNCDHLDAESKYTLVLGDGSSATIRASDLSECEDKEADRHAVEFYVVGELRASGRRQHGLDLAGRRGSSA